MTETDLSDVQTTLESESAVLAAEKGKQDRMAASITDQINIEAQVPLETARCAMKMLRGTCTNMRMHMYMYTVTCTFKE